MKMIELNGFSSTWNFMVLIYICIYSSCLVSHLQVISLVHFSRTVWLDASCKIQASFFMFFFHYIYDHYGTGICCGPTIPNIQLLVKDTWIVLYYISKTLLHASALWASSMDHARPTYLVLKFNFLLAKFGRYKN